MFSLLSVLEYGCNLRISNANNHGILCTPYRRLLNPLTDGVTRIPRHCAWTAIYTDFPTSNPISCLLSITLSDLRLKRICTGSPMNHQSLSATLLNSRTKIWFEPFYHATEKKKNKAQVSTGSVSIMESRDTKGRSQPCQVLL